MYDDEPTPAVGMVPVEGRGSLPFALLHNESLVAVASWALGEAGVELLDFTESWEQVQARETALVVHDPLCPGTSVDFLRGCVAALDETPDAVVVGARPVTDTVRAVDERGVLGETADRSELLAVTSPVVLPASVVASLPELPALDDVADLVVALRAAHHVLEIREAPPAGRRVTDESDLRLLEALSADPETPQPG